MNALVKFICVLKGIKHEVVISVHNEGDAIPFNNQVTLFDSFTRAEDKDSSMENARPNFGLGLFITPEIVLSHDGTINVISNENEGTIFSVWLPKAEV